MRKSGPLPTSTLLEVLTFDYTPGMVLRRFPLMPLGYCAYVLIGLPLESTEEQDVLIRIMQGLMSCV